MTRKNLLSLMVFSILAAGCSRDTGVEAAQPKKADPATSGQASGPRVEIDISTPDRALKSYWAVRDSISLREQQVYREMSEKTSSLRKQIDEVAVTSLFAMVESDRAEDVYLRDIVNVEVESESRAVIFARIRNATPMPIGAQPSEYEAKARREGDQYKYILERDPQGWKVAEIWGWRDYGEEGWVKDYPSDGLPSVRTLTMTGV